MANVMTLLFVLISLVSLAASDNYLVMFPPETGSQTVALATAASTMIERNHSVTLLVTESFKDNVMKRMQTDKYTMEVFKSSVTVETFKETQTALTGNALQGNYLGMMKVMYNGSNLFYQQCDDFFSDKKLLKRLESQKFDLVFAHVLLGCPTLLAQYLDVKFVTLLTAIPPPMLLRIYGNPVNPSYSPEMPLGFSNRMSFLQRVKNTIVSGATWMMSGSVYSMYDELKVKYNIKPEVSTFKSVTQSEILFVCSHFVLDFPRAFQPNVISVGGLSAIPPKPLPSDLEKFMQSSGDDGVIIFSMGSYINAMEAEKANMIAEAFAKLPQKILWKLGGEPPSKIPSNVKISKWLPQNDVLGHPKTRLLIYHCGLNGVFEAIYHAVPVICIPVLGDQWDDAERLVTKGVGMELDWFSLTSKAIVGAVNTVIGDKSYQTNMNRLSAIFHDEHLPAAQRVVYWMEKVVRHGGAEHLRPSAALELNSLQHNLIDVIAFIAVIVFIVLAIVVKLVTACFRCCFGCCKGSSKQKSE